MYSLTAVEKSSFFNRFVCESLYSVMVIGDMLEFCPYLADFFLLFIHFFPPK
uniref:Ovule protein n=1 Tax=Ascaris lumbricoides TaxID=6252 RepID=A0A0M3HP68_ASCLU